MLRFFRVKKDVKGVNPLNDAKNTYYEEVSAGGLQPNERALKVCYQNGDIWEARNLTTESDQTAITKIFNSTLYEFNGFFIIKNKNDIASKEYYCFITVDKTNEIKEDKHWLIWLTVYYDLDGSTGFKILLRWDLEQFIFTIVKNPIKINLLEDDNFNKEENHYSLPTVAVIRKWYYHKEWLEINTPINNSQSMIYSIPVKCPMEDIELEMPKEDVIRQLIRARTNKTDKEYDLLSMDFGRQAGYNGYNSMIISMNQINTYDNMKAGSGKAWLTFLGTNKYHPFGINAFLIKILDKDGMSIKHPLIRNYAGSYGYFRIKTEDGEGFKLLDTVAFKFYSALNTDYMSIGGSYIPDTNKTCFIPSFAMDYPPFSLYHVSQYDTKGNPYTIMNVYGTDRAPSHWSYDYQFQEKEDKETVFLFQSQIPEFADKPLEERYYMPIWDKLIIVLNPSNFIYDGTPLASNTDYGLVRKPDGTIPSTLKTMDIYWGHNSHLQLKYLIGYWKARS